MKRWVFPLVVTVVAVNAAYYGYAIYPHPPAQNPDPNHTHADFAVFIQGKQVDFSDAKYMSGSSTDPSSHPTEGLRKYLHLHDGNGHVIHRHKPGLTLGEFFDSLSGKTEVKLFTRTENNKTYTQFSICTYPDPPPTLEWYCDATTVRVFSNGQEVPQGANYAFKDTDHILITDALDQAQIDTELKAMTDDACLYSRTCPQRGDPPTENCIADPEVPCVLP